MTLALANEYVEKHRVNAAARPLFHVSPPVGWLNDPNGFSVFKGEYHLFYQYHPYDVKWGPMHWGHMKSKDLVKWEELPVALAPDNVYDKKGCFSGSAIEKDGKHYLIYTGVMETSLDGQLVVRQNQCLAIGDGVSYTKYPINPVISYDQLPEGFSQEHFRDPKVWQQGASYFLVAGNLNSNHQGQVVLFESLDLTNWEYRGVLALDDTNEYGLMWECPDFFALDDCYVLICSPQFMRAKNLEFHNGHNSVYFLGNYENNCFSKGQGKSLDYGLDFYAPQTTELDDGRRVLIGWLKSWDSVSSVEGLEWQGMMTLPRELSLKGDQLIQKPISELANYRKNPIQTSCQISEWEQVEGVTGRVIDLIVTLSGTNYTQFYIDLACNQDYYTRFTYDRLAQTIIGDRTYSGLTLDQNCQRSMSVADQSEIELRFILDTHSIELFVNDGEQVFSMEIETPLVADSIRFASNGIADVAIEKYDLHIND